MLIQAPPGLTLRRAIPGDAQQLAGLCQEHAAYEAIPFQAEGHTNRLGAALADGQLHAWLAEQDGLLGYATATVEFATLTGAPFVHMDCLYLREAARGLGLGPRLMEAVRTFARDQGCRSMEWQTPEWNAGAIRFYERLGAQRRTKARFTLGV